MIEETLEKKSIVDQKAIEQKDKDFQPDPPKRIGCCTRFWTFFGFNPSNSDDNTILDMQRSFNRSFLSKVSEPIMPALNIGAAFGQSIVMFPSLKAFTGACVFGPDNQSASTKVALGPSCQLDWILFGPNQVSLGWFLFLVVSLLNLCYFSTTSQFAYAPVTILVQWILYVTVVPFSFLAFIVLFTEWGGYNQPEYVQANQKLNLSLAVIYTLIGFYEIRLRHVLWVSFIYGCHLSLILIVDASTGIFADHPATALTADVFFGGAGIFYLILLAVMVVLLVVHWIKLRYFAAGTLMKTSIISHLIPSEDPTPEQSQQLSQV